MLKLDFPYAGSIVVRAGCNLFPSRRQRTYGFRSRRATKRLPELQIAISTEGGPMAANPIPLPELSLETVRNQDEILVRCTGRITSSTSASLQTTVRALIPQTRRLVLDLTDVTYLDSSGLGALVGIYVSARRQECELKLINLNDRLKQLFRISQIAKIFEGHEDMLGMTPD
jgi:anti-sigma B factor antagonist